MNMLKKSLALLLTLCMLISVVPLTVFAADTTDGTAAASETGTDFYRILHLDCGRKYFTKDWIIALINEMAAAGYNQLQLAFGNDGLRFLLDDMSVGSYSDDAVTAAIQAGNKAYYDFGTNELTESEMTEIITYANSKGIDVVPHLNLVGHMNAALTAMLQLGINDARFAGTSKTSLNLQSDTAVAFAHALAQKYVDYFKDQGIKYFHIGADEFANDGTFGTNTMGFQYMGDVLYAKYIDYVNDYAQIVKNAGMTPRAWNDGLYYGSYSGYSAIDTSIQCTYWSNGWWGYNVASAAKIAEKHDMINTHGSYYFVLTANGITNPSTDGFTNSGFMGSTINDPVGSMFCIWCDAPGSATEQETAEAVRLTLRKMAARMQGTSDNSSDVVPGGFNADGSINYANLKTETVDNVSVTAPDLTGLTVVAKENPDINVENATAIKAWEMTPTTADGNYTSSATVSVPVPEDWTNVRGGVLQTANGDYKEDIRGTLKDGVFTFDVPHFSTVFTYNVAATAEGGDEGSSGGTTGGDTSDAVDHTNHRIELNVGQRVEFDINGANVNNENTTTVIQTNPTGYATVTVTHVYQEGTGVTKTLVESPTDGKTYYIKNSAGQYLSAAPGWVDNIEDAVAWTVIRSGISINLSYSGSYLACEYGKTEFFLTSNLFHGDLEYFDLKSSEWIGYNSNTKVTFYEVSGSESINKSTYTVEGIAHGTTYANINGAEYKIIVHRMVDITINYVDSEDNTNVIKTETKTVRDDVTSIELSNITTDDGKYYTVENTTLAITPTTQTEYTVTVNESEVNLDTVDALTIEYWQTNAQAEEQFGSNVKSKTISAASVYSENGVDISNIIPLHTYKVGAAENDPMLVYWRSNLLERASNEQTGADGDDETMNGTIFTKVRYWNGSWAVYTENNEWVNVNAVQHQLVSYYMNDMNLADEVSVATSDWGKKGNGEFANSYLGADHVSIAFQVVYEDGTTAPISTTASDLAKYTYLVDRSGTRGVGTIAINQIGDYQIWKITAETGTHETDYRMWGATTVTKFTWDDNNETTVWEGDPVSSYTISNSQNSPSVDGAYANLTWDEPNESILIRIYIKAVETEDSLKVVYYDEKFGDTLVEYSVIVPNDSTFNNGIVEANSTTEATLPAFAGNAARVDATGYGIVNALGKTQNFRTDLTQVPEAVGKYNNDLYKYTGSVVSADGLTITHYYIIDTDVLSPNIVADFGLPLTFELTDVVRANQEGLVKNVTVNERTRYGTLSYNNGTFTYTPTSILQNIDVLTINILFDGESSESTTNVGVTPATTVYYDDSFIGTGTGWSRDGKSVTVNNQAAEEMNTSEEKTNKKNNYGYDPAYASVSGASHGTYLTSQTIGDTTSFEFTGTGIQVFAYATTGTGYVSAKITDANGAIKKVYMVDTVVDPGTTSATSGQTGSLYGLPIISIVDVTGLDHGTYTVTLTKIMDTDPVYIDGIRVFGTIADSSIFKPDLEDDPKFYELRDHVLNAVNITDTTTADQVYAAISTDSEAPAVITSPADIYGTDATAQDLLDNGPKNELYLYKNQTLTFNVKTARTMQIGLKAPAGQTTVEAKTTVGSTTSTVDLIKDADDIISSTVDMFYTLVGAPTESDTTYNVSIKNTGDKVLSVTLLKICDDPNAAFVPLTIEDIETILAPDVPTADASLTVNITNRSGKVMKTVTLTANGVAGETHTFTEEEILAAISDVLGKDYIAARGSSIDDVEVVYGESDVLSVDKNDDIMRIHKINNHKSRPGKGSDKGNGKHK